MRRETYWRGVAARLLPAAVVAAAVALLMWWLEGTLAAVITGLVTLAVCTLLPARARR